MLDVPPPSGVTRRPKRTESNFARLLDASAGGSGSTRDAVLEVRGADLDDLGALRLEQRPAPRGTLPRRRPGSRRGELLETPTRSPRTSPRAPSRAASAKDGQASGSDVESSGSWPPMTSCSRAASSTVRVTGPTWSRRRGERDRAVAADAAVRGLDADRAGDVRGLADRAAGVGAERQRRLEARRRPRPSRRRNRRGCGRGPTGCGSGRTRSARWTSPSRTRPCWSCRAGPGPPRAARDDGGVVRRDQPSRMREPARGRHVRRDEHVLDRERHARERAERLARRATAVDAGGDSSAWSLDVEEGVHVAVDGGDAVEVRRVASTLETSPEASCRRARPRTRRIRSLTAPPPGSP